MPLSDRHVHKHAQLGGLGPGLTGEHTLYSFVVVRGDKRWVLKKRYSQLLTLDQQLHDAYIDSGGDGNDLPEVPCPLLPPIFIYLDALCQPPLMHR
jgi:hypothetical protein